MQVRAEAGIEAGKQIGGEIQRNDHVGNFSGRLRRRSGRRGNRDVIVPLVEHPYGVEDYGDADESLKEKKELEEES